MSAARQSAFIVANDDYADQRLRRLRAPAADAEKLGAVLQDPDVGGFDVNVSINEPEHVVRRKLSAFFDDRGLDDLLVLHLSCHGLKDEDGRLYFATVDTELDHLEATAIPSEFVNRQMTRSRSRRIVLLLDCCYSGAFAAGMLSRSDGRVDIKERFDGRGRVVLTASSAMEYSFEGDQVEGEGRPSVFTSALVRGLTTGEADRNRDGWISVDELYEYAYDEVRAVTPSQTPGKWVFDVQGDLYVARSTLPPVVEEVAPPPAPAAVPAKPAEPERPPEIPDRPVPARAVALARGGAVALLAAVLIPVLGAGFETWNAFAVLPPFEAALTAVLGWRIADGLRRGRTTASVGAGVLLALGALSSIGALGLIKFSLERIGGAAPVLAVVVLLGGVAMLAAGVLCLGSVSRSARIPAVDPAALVLGLCGAALALVALFMTYDGASSLWSEMREVDSAEFFFEPMLAVVVALAGLVALGTRPRLAGGLLLAVGAVTTLHHLGVVIAAWRAIGEVGEVQGAGFIGALGGLLILATGAYVHQSDKPGAAPVRG